MTELKIDPEFRDKIPPLTDAEFKQLEENIVADGEVREPIVAWDGTIIDGHNRWAIIQKHPEIPYRVKKMEFSDKWAAIYWMVNNQLGRRNITDEQKTYLLGKLYEARKNTQGGDRKSAEFSSTQCGNLKSEKPNRVSEQIAKERGIAKNSVIRANNFAHGLDAADTVAPGFKEQVLTGAVKAPKSTIAEIAKMDEPERKQAVENIKAGKKPRTAKNAKVRSDNAAIRDIVANLKTDKPAFSCDGMPGFVERVIQDCTREVKDYLRMHKEEADGNTAKKIIAALDEAQTAMEEMKGWFNHESS